MNIFSVFLLLLAEFYWSEQANIQPRIFYGHKIDREKAPYQARLVGIIIDGLKISSSPSSCGGTLISHKHILTAAHCLYTPRKKPLEKNAEVIIELGAREYVSKEWIRHEKFKRRGDNKGSAYDIALLTLTENVIFSDKVRASKLPKRSDKESDLINQKIFVTGYGRSEELMLSGGLRATTLFVNNDLCVDGKLNPTVFCASSERSFEYPELTNSYLEIEQNSILSKEKDRPSHTGSGDSGGPAVINNTIFGVACAGPVNPDDPPVSVFTSVIQFLDWIEKHSDLNIED